MKQWIRIAIVVILVLGGLEWQKRRSAVRAHLVPSVTGSPAGFHQPREDVGWVFGRLVGIPGAEKPLSGGNAFLLPPAPGP